MVCKGARVARSTVDLDLAVVLRRLRVERGISQETLAHDAGLTSGSYARIELGQAATGWSTVRSIAAALGVTLADLAAAVEAEKS